jgi:hypothetical protein
MPCRRRTFRTGPRKYSVERAGFLTSGDSLCPFDFPALAREQPQYKAVLVSIATSLCGFPAKRTYAHLRSDFG